MNEEVSRDMTGEADGKNPGVDSTDACLNERSVIFNDEMVGGRERVTTEGTARGLNRDHIFNIARLTGCKNFVGKRKKFIFNAFVDLKPVERSENRSDM